MNAILSFVANLLSSLNVKFYLEVQVDGVTLNFGTPLSGGTSTTAATHTLSQNLPTVSPLVQS
jgi:hypothetical protein